MSDISKIKLPDGSEFNIKDAAAARSADLAAVATSGSYNDLINAPDSDVFVVRTTSATPTTDKFGNLYYPTDKTYAETFAAMRAGKQVVLIHVYEDQYTPSIYYGTSSYESGNMSFTSINFNINVNNYNFITIRSAIFNTNGVRFTILLNDSTRKNLSSSFYTNNSLPRTSGQPGQVPVVGSNGSYLLNWTNLPTVPTNVSSFTNDAGYLTLATLPIYDGSVE